MTDQLIIRKDGRAEILREEEWDHERPLAVITRSGAAVPLPAYLGVEDEADRELVVVRKSTPQLANATLAMVCFYLPDEIAQQIAFNSQDAKDLHLTLLFLGEAAKLDAAALAENMSIFAARHDPIEGELSGVGWFIADDAEKGDPIYASFDGPALAAFRQDLITTLGQDLNASEHGFTPHITLAYANSSNSPVVIMSAAMINLKPNGKKIPVRFDSVTLKIGGERSEFKLQRPEQVRDPNYTGDTPRDPHGKWTSGGAKPVEFTATWHADDYTPAEKVAIEGYTAAWFMPMNDSLRNPGTDLEEKYYGWKALSGKQSVQGYVDQTIPHLDSAIARTELREPETVYRRVHDDSFLPPVGGSFVDPGFVSTSRSGPLQNGFGDHVLKISVPAGTKALWVGGNQGELILPRNSAFQVTSAGATQTTLKLVSDATRSARDSNYTGETPRDPHGQWTGGALKGDTLMQSQLVTNLTHEEETAVGNADFINSRLRGKPAPGDEASKNWFNEKAGPTQQAFLDSAIDKAPALSGEAVVYRGISAASFTGEPGAQEILWRDTKDITFIDHGYAFTSVDRDMALQYAGFKASQGEAAAIAELHISSGIHLLNAGDASPGMNEMILPRGLTYHVDSVSGIGSRLPKLKITVSQ